MDPRGTPRAFLDPSQDPPGVCRYWGDDFCLGNLFYYYELKVCSLKGSKLGLISSSHLGLMVMSLAFHQDDPGSIPRRNSFLSTFNFFFNNWRYTVKTLLIDTQKKCKAARSGMHLKIQVTSSTSSLVCNVSCKVSRVKFWSSLVLMSNVRCLRSDNFKMSLWKNSFSQNTNEIISEFLTWNFS